MSAQRPYILWLPSWYPNKIEPYHGDFIQRHAKAVALKEKVHVIYVVKDVAAVVTKNVKTETRSEGQLSETIVYYHVPPLKIPLIEKLLSFRKYMNLSRKAVNAYLNTWGKPQLVHVYVAFKAGLVALWIKRSYKIPYVVSEQYTIYLPEAKPNFTDYSFPVRLLFKRIFRRANSLMVVSDYLGQHLQRLFHLPKPVVIPNVVDQNLFSYTENSNEDITRFIHISTLNYQKNPEAILKAFSIVKQKGFLFRLDIVGPLVPELLALSRKYGLEDCVFFLNEMPQQQLVRYIQRSDALLLYSRFETFGCVIAEAHACGVPVIVSDIPVFHENVTDGCNGLFAANENADDLASKIIYFIKNKQLFDKGKIAKQAAEKFGYRRVADLFSHWYSQSK